MAEIPLLVTGSTGFVGSYLVPALCSQGQLVRALLRDPTKGAALRDCGAETVQGDLRDRDSLSRAVEGCRAVIHLAAVADSSDEDLNHQVNVVGSRNLAQACAGAGVKRIINVSSTCAGRSLQDAYGRTKREAEAEFVDFDVTHLRPTMIYGPGDDRNVSRLRDHVRRARLFPVFGTGEGAVQPVHVEDVARAAVAALDAPASVRQAYEIAGGDAMPYRQMVDVVCAAAGAMVIKLYIPMLFGVPLVRLYGVVSNSPKVTLDQVRRMDEDRDFDTSAAQRDLGFQPRSFAEGLRDAMQQNGEEVNPVWERSF